MYCVFSMSNQKEEDEQSEGCTGIWNRLGT